MYIEGIVLDNFSAVPQTNINSNTPSHQRYAVFQYCLSDNNKHDAATTTSHRKRLLPLLKYKKVLTRSFRKTWENNDGCAKKFRCASALYLLAVMFQC